MFCKKCGEEIANESIFCNICGAKQDEQTTEDSKRKLNKSKIVIPSAALVLIIVAIIFSFKMTNNPVKKFLTLSNKNKYDEAFLVYDEKVKGNTDKEAQLKEALEKDIKDILDNFTNNSQDYDQVTLTLNNMKKTNLLNKKVKDTLKQIDSLHSSRVSYGKGLEFKKLESYAEAVEAFNKVIESDENYEKAQEEIVGLKKDYKNIITDQIEASAQNKEYDDVLRIIKEALNIIKDDGDLLAQQDHYKKINDDIKAEELRLTIEELKNQQLLTIKSTAIKVQDTKHKALYPDMIQVVVENKSQETIKDYELACLAFDENGYPVKIKTQYDFSGGDFEFIGLADNVNIIPDASFGANVGWSLDDPHGISTVLACPKSVVFYDGTRWDNPYYKYWVKEYKEKQLQ